jgi:hypothetical protein
VNALDAAETIGARTYKAKLYGDVGGKCEKYK